MKVYWTVVVQQMLWDWNGKMPFLRIRKLQTERRFKTLPGETGFKFGSESIVKSLEKYEFRCYIAGEKTTITADVVDREIPLLISKAEMKKRGFKINLEDDSLEI